MKFLDISFFEDKNKKLLYLTVMHLPLFTAYLEVIRWIFIAQFLFICLHIVFSIFLGTILQVFNRRKQTRDATLKKMLLAYVQQQAEEDSIQIPLRFRTIPLLIPTIIAIDNEIKDAHWNKIKQILFEKWLNPSAQDFTHSRKWTKRIQATGCFLLFTSSNNEKQILHLLKDSTPIIQYSAAFCAAKLGSEQCTNAVIDQMNQVNRFLRLPFREALLRGNPSSFTYLETRLANDRHPFARLSCLEVLKDRMNAHVAELAKRDLYATEKNLRIAAIRALGHYPDPTNAIALIPLLKDLEWEVRALAARSLGYLRAKEALAELEVLLRDENWWVQMNSAIALKRLGEEGKRQLEKQLPTDTTYKIAQYVLMLDLYA